MELCETDFTPVLLSECPTCDGCGTTHVEANADEIFCRQESVAYCDRCRMDNEPTTGAA